MPAKSLNLFKSPFARNLSLKIALATSVLLSLVLLVATIILTRIAKSNCNAYLDEQLKLCSEKIDSGFGAVEKFGHNTAQMIGYVPTDSTSYGSTLTGLLESNPDIFGITVYLETETALRSGLVGPIVERGDDGKSVAFRPSYIPKWTREIVADMYVSGIETAKDNPWYGPYHEPLRNLYELSYLTTSRETSGGTGCIVETVVTMDWMVGTLNSFKPTPNATAYVTDERGKIICTSETGISISGDEAGVNTMSEWNEDNSINQEIVIEQAVADDGKKNISRSSELGNGWKLHVTCPLSEVFRDANRSVGVMGLGLLVSIILLFFFCTRIILAKVKPLQQFASASGAIAHGDFDTELPVIKGNDEVSQLRDSFANMQVSLKEYIKNLAEVTATKQRMESELNIATGIQMQALRKLFPASERFDLYADMHAAKEVGGDLYDFTVKGDKLYLCVGDVSGKGVPAALIMMTATMMFRHICTTEDRPLNEMMSIINNCVADGNDSGFFVTMFLACIDLSTREMRYCNGGHNDIIVIGPDGRASFNKANPNIACGILPGYRYKEESIQLEKGGRVLLYTDGVNEAMNAANEEFGNGRLLEWAGSSLNLATEKAAVEDLLSSVKAFTDGAEQSDDVTVLSVRIR